MPACLHTRLSPRTSHKPETTGEAAAGGVVGCSSNRRDRRDRTIGTWLKVPSLIIVIHRTTNYSPFIPFHSILASYRSKKIIRNMAASTLAFVRQSRSNIRQTPTPSLSSTVTSVGYRVTSTILDFAEARAAWRPSICPNLPGVIGPGRRRFSGYGGPLPQSTVHGTISLSSLKPQAHGKSVREVSRMFGMLHILIDADLN
jgi:hypothetical protein